MNDMDDQPPRHPRAYSDVLYERTGRAAVITINRPERYNAFTAHTIDELIHAFRVAWADPEVSAVILTGAGDRAFCAGGDVKQRAATGDYGPSEFGVFDIDGFHRILREIPKPVIAAVNGFAIGGGHVIQVLCDLTIAASTATFGQVGPQVGSFDAGFGAAYLARVIGEKRARRMWYLCEQIDAATAEEWGLANEVVEPDQLLPTALEWAARLAQRSPTALEFLKYSFNADTEHQAGYANMSRTSLRLYLATAEGREGAAAFAEKRDPDFVRARDGGAP
jgi:naphthoate synthase